MVNISIYRIHLIRFFAIIECIGVVYSLSGVFTFWDFEKVKRPRSLTVCQKFTSYLLPYDIDTGANVVLKRNPKL